MNLKYPHVRGFLFLENSQADSDSMPTTLMIWDCSFLFKGCTQFKNPILLLLLWSYYVNFQAVFDYSISQLSPRDYGRPGPLADGWVGALYS